METIFFILGLTVLLTLLFNWCFRNLSKEKWQFLFAMPREKQITGEWVSTNFTYYGFFTAWACVFGAAMVFFLLGTTGVLRSHIYLLMIIVFTVCLPSAKIIAKIVEGKAHTQSIGGASFLGIIITPWVIYFLNPYLSAWTGHSFEILPTLAALAIAYAFGEAIGRLACISYGCCYGKPINEAPKWLLKIIGYHYFIFHGVTKKAAYADHYDGLKVVPVQAITSILYAVTGLIGIVLFLKGFYAAAYLLAIGITQIWRFLSEFLRADYRGDRAISIYQIMGLVAVIYVVIITVIFPADSSPKTQLLSGIKLLWDPLLILSLQLLWLIAFIFSGKSKVTGSTIEFHVHRHQI